MSRRRMLLVVASLLLLVTPALVGYEIDVEHHAGVEVYRHERFVPLWQRYPDDHRERLHWRAGPPPESRGAKVITQWFLFGLARGGREEYWLRSGSIAMVGEGPGDR